MQRRTLYGGGLVATGLLLAGTQFVQGLQQIGGFEGTDRLLVFSFETVPFLLVALALAFVGYWLTTQQQFEPDPAEPFYSPEVDDPATVGHLVDAMTDAGFAVTAAERLHDQVGVIVCDRREEGA